jgi:hypothetical protein
MTEAPSPANSDEDGPTTGGMASSFPKVKMPSTSRVCGACGEHGHNSGTCNNKSSAYIVQKEPFVKTINKMQQLPAHLWTQLAQGGSFPVPPVPDAGAALRSAYGDLDNLISRCQRYLAQSEAHVDSDMDVDNNHETTTSTSMAGKKSRRAEEGGGASSDLGRSPFRGTHSPGGRKKSAVQPQESLPRPTVAAARPSAMDMIRGNFPLRHTAPSVPLNHPPSASSDDVREGR